MAWTPAIGEYLLPTTLDHLPNLEETLENLWVQDPILMVDLNIDLDDSRNPRSQIVAKILMEFFLIDFMHHFWQRHCFHHLKTWTQV